MISMPRQPGDMQRKASADSIALGIGFRRFLRSPSVLGGKLEYKEESQYTGSHMLEHTHIDSVIERSVLCDWT